MKVGILGSARVGKELAIGFMRLGHEVKIGTRKVDLLKDFLEKTGKEASAGSFAETAAFGELLVFAVAWSGAENVVRLAGKENFSGKTVIDVTNPLTSGSGAIYRPLISYPGSAGATLQEWLKKAHVVKAFNIVPAHLMCNPQMQEGKPDLFIAGNDEDAKACVSGLAKNWGWESIHNTGDIDQACWLEAMTVLWLLYAYRNDSWDHAFKLLKR